MNTQSDEIKGDTIPFDTDEKSEKKPKRSKSSNGPEGKKSNEACDWMKVSEIMERVDKATAFLDTEEFQRAASVPVPNPAPAYSGGTGGTGGSQFNIIGGTIGQAAIGNVGDVTFNQEQKVFEKGSNQSNFDISGGNFAQANIGGTANYKNEGGTLIAGGGGCGGGIPFFTPEQLTLHILERGVTCKQLADLLDRQYTLVNLAFALPRDPLRRNDMVNALLGDNAMEVN